MILKRLLYVVLFWFLMEVRVNSSASKIQRFFARTTSLRCQHPDVVFDVSSLSLCAAACSQDENCLGFNLNRFDKDVGRICEVVNSKDNCNYHTSFSFYEAINPDHADTSLTPVATATTSASANARTSPSPTDESYEASVLSTTTDESTISIPLTSAPKDPTSAASTGVVSFSSTAQMFTVSNPLVFISAAIPSTSATPTAATTSTALATSSSLSTLTDKATPSTAIVQSTTSITTTTPSPTTLSSSETSAVTGTTTTAATTTLLSPATATLTTSTMPATTTTTQTTTTPTTTKTTPSTTTTTPTSTTTTQTTTKAPTTTTTTTQTTTTTSPTTTTQTTTTAPITTTTAEIDSTVSAEGSQNDKCSDNTGNYAIVGIDVSNWLILHTGPFALEDNGEDPRTVYKGKECDPGWALTQIGCYSMKCDCKRVGTDADLDNNNCEEVSGKSGDIMCPNQKIATKYSYALFTSTHALKCCTLTVF